MELTELKAEMDQRFEQITAEGEKTRRHLEQQIRADGEKTRRHFDVVVEQMKAERNLVSWPCGS